MDLGLLVRLCAFPHYVAPSEPVRPCICELSRLRQRDAVFPRIYADRWTRSQAGDMGLSVARNGAAQHCWRTVGDKLAQEFIIGKFPSERRPHELAAHSDAFASLARVTGAYAPDARLLNL